VQTPEEIVHYLMTKTAQVAVVRVIAKRVAGTDVTMNRILTGADSFGRRWQFIEV